jgi:hypothetical protein
VFTLPDLKNVILKELGGIFLENGFEPTIDDIRTAPSVADSSQIFAVGNPTRRAILMLSPADFPNVVADAQAKEQHKSNRAFDARDSRKIGTLLHARPIFRCSKGGRSRSQKLGET